MDVPSHGDAIEAAQEATRAARDRGRTLIPWLPDPPSCEGCGALTFAAETFDPRQACYVTSWHCRACDQHTYRDPVYGDDRPPGPREGAPAIRELLTE